MGLESAVQRIPEAAHLMTETDSAGTFYFVDKTDFERYFKAISKGSTVTEISDRGAVTAIGAVWPDLDNNYIYVANQKGAVNVDTEAFQVDTSDDSVTEFGSITDVADWFYLVDIFMISTDLFLLIRFKDDATGDYSIKVYLWNDPNWNIQDTLAVGGAPTFTRVAVVGAVVYFVSYNAVDGTDVYSYTHGTTTIASIEDCGAYTLAAGWYQQNIIYDESDKLYFLLTSGGNDYFSYYSISDDSVTIGSLYDIEFMLERNCLETANSPWEFEKGFEYQGSKIYQFSRLYGSMVKIQDLGLTGGDYIRAISDHYLVTNDGNVYEYTNLISELSRAKGNYKTHGFPKGRFEYTTSLSTDQIIEIYENNEGTYTLCFRGKLGTPKYTIRKGKPFYQFRPKNFGWNDLNQKVSYVATAEDPSDVVIALLGQLTNPYLYGDATSIPNIDAPMTYTFDDVRLKDALYVCCILGNAYWWFEPNGYFHFYTWAEKPPSPWYLGSGGFNYETVGTSGTDIDWIDSHTLYNGEAEIVEEWQDHKNILRLLDDATPGEDPSITHIISQAMSGTYEFYVGTNNVTKDWRINFRETTPIIIYLRIQSSKLYYRDEFSVFQEIQAVVNDTLYHIKVVWRADNTFDVYVNGDLKADNKNTTSNQVSGINNLLIYSTGDSTDYLYIDAPGLVGETDPKGVVYTEGLNLLVDPHSQTTNNIGPQKAVITQIQYNSYNNVRGGWNEATSSEFTPTTPTVAAHVQQYGPLEWPGRKSFVGAITQASLDAIITGLKAWQGIDENPVDAQGFVIGKYYYPVGYYVSHQYTGRTEFATPTDRLIIKNETNFKTPGKIKLTLSTNLVRKS